MAGMSGDERPCFEAFEGVYAEGGDVVHWLRGDDGELVILGDSFYTDDPEAANTPSAARAHMEEAFEGTSPRALIRPSLRDGGLNVAPCLDLSDDGHDWGSGVPPYRA